MRNYIFRRNLNKILRDAVNINLVSSNVYNSTENPQLQFTIIL